MVHWHPFKVSFHQLILVVGKKVLSKLEARHMRRPAKRAAGESHTLEDSAS